MEVQNLLSRENLRAGWKHYLAATLGSVVLDARKDVSFLLILDAATFQELARAELPHHVPFGFHGNYFAATKSAASVRELHG